MSDIKPVDIRGLLDTYEFPCKLPGSGDEILIKPITTGQMKKILVYEEETDSRLIEDALDRLINECVVTENFDVGKLYLQDRFYLLVELRKVSKGSAYNFNFKCPKCKTDNIKQFSLDDLGFTEKQELDNVIEINERLKFEVDFPTRANQKDAAERYANTNLSEKEKIVETITATFANSIKRVLTPDGWVDDVPFEQKVFILDNIPTDVYDTFRDWFSDNSFGIDFNVEVKCAHCDFSETTDIPLSDFFV